jgi:hypothetical protein
MGASPLPVGEPGIEIDCVQIDGGGIELFQIRSLRAFNFPVQVEEMPASPAET